MILNDIGMLVVSNNRTKAYLQNIKKSGLIPSICIIMDNNPSLLENEVLFYKPSDLEPEYFDLNEPILYTIKKMNIPYIILKTNNVNSLEVIEQLENIFQKYIIVSGFSGQILQSELFNIDKKYIHIHSGILPNYRGSTTIYYSLISENKCGATAIFLDKKIDTGDIILSKTFEINKDTPNIDTIYDPFIRSQVLVDVLEKYMLTNSFKCTKQNYLDGETFFIIHPILKHIAILSLTNKQWTFKDYFGKYT